MTALIVGLVIGAFASLAAGVRQAFRDDARREAELNDAP